MTIEDNLDGQIDGVAVRIHINYLAVMSNGTYTTNEVWALYKQYLDISKPGLSEGEKLQLVSPVLRHMYGIFSDEFKRNHERVLRETSPIQSYFNKKLDDWYGGK